MMNDTFIENALKRTDARWMVNIYYRSEEGAKVLTLYVEEPSELNDLEDVFPHWDTFLSINMVLNRPATDLCFTTEKARELTVDPNYPNVEKYVLLLVDPERVPTSFDVSFPDDTNFIPNTKPVDIFRTINQYGFPSYVYVCKNAPKDSFTFTILEHIRNKSKFPDYHIEDYFGARENFEETLRSYKSTYDFL